MKTAINLIICSLFVLLFFDCSSNDSDTEPENEDIETTIYFPPIDNDTWESTPVTDLDWNETELQNLYDFLEENNSKSFMILYNGKIVVEKYFNDHDEDTNWYWASAGKTLTTAITGIAQEEGYLNINDKVSDYIGAGWTSATTEQEALITNKHLLTMTSGLDDSDDYIAPEDLTYLADAGTRWAYHGVFLKLQDVVATATGSTWNSYFNTKLKDEIGMNGFWFPFESTNVYWSNTRSMARFGLLMYANGKWEDSQIIPEDFLNEAINTSQTINEAYGYMWWLNGKASYHLPQTQYEFNGELIPNAPDDMYAGLGKNDQKLYVIPSKKLVIIRMGDAASEENFALSTFDNDLWEKINNLIN
ncbi:beta-lactamase family protein [Tamlana sp. 62-3]|uniref:Beta-lactamase family protein n=1 Tax=Neotamlana sargassicola TaxID=2883125 RepID=A0A9X1L4H0_9FLAO|nr:serine hydrolase [Tamlana sargassicola]MCB4808070.1 beta-lactamase family protein [Tamlana sargassicola]